MFLRILENEARNARPNAERKSTFETSHLEIRMFNVDHGEAILVVFDNQHAWLIDAGCSNHQTRNDKLASVLVKYLEDRSLMLEAIIPSHPHADHAGSLADILGSGSSRVAPVITMYRSEDRTWKLDRIWLNKFWNAIGNNIVDISLRNSHREISISEGVSARIFAGSGEGAYTSLFVHLRYHDARILFTGDSECDYETELLDMFGEEDFRADVLKITHHGSSSGTASSIVNAVKPGIAIASTGDDGGHRLERDTLDRLGGRPGPRRVFETLVDGDIILRTDGFPYRGGMLYQVECDPPGVFSNEAGAGIMFLPDVDDERTSSLKKDCVEVAE